MRTRQWKRLVASAALAMLAIAVGVGPVAAQSATDYELWVVDQANTDVGGSKLYVYRGAQLSGSALTGAPETIDLTASAQGVGDGPGVRPHLLLFNARHTHGVLAAVASGVVLVLRSSLVSKEQVRRSVQALKAADARLLGCVLNGVPSTSGDSEQYQYTSRPHIRVPPEPRTQGSDPGQPADVGQTTG